MNKVQRVASNSYSCCPICSNKFVTEEGPGWKLKMHHMNFARVFLCFNPLASDPWHCYTHVVDTSDPDFIAFQEFEVDLGSKSVLFSNDYQKQKSQIKNNIKAVPLIFPAMLMPDYPKLESLKSKIRTIITFS